MLLSLHKFKITFFFKKFRRGAEKASNGLSTNKRGGQSDETGLNEAELQSVNNQIGISIFASKKNV